MSEPLDKEKSQQISRKTKKILTAIDNAYNELRKQEQVGNLSFIHRISLNLEQDKVETMMRNLINGYLVTKHSIATKQPHQKYLYISEDRRFLNWKSIDKADQKMIELRKIDYIAHGSDLQDFKKSLTLNNSKKNCFIVNSETRILEIQCRSEEEADKIVHELDEAVKNSRRMHLSYRF